MLISPAYRRRTETKIEIQQCPDAQVSFHVSPINTHLHIHF